jgi:hypothetical protein
MRYRNGKILLRFLAGLLSLALSVSAQGTLNASMPVVHRNGDAQTPQSQPTLQTNNKPTAAAERRRKIQKGESSKEPVLVNTPKRSCAPGECKELAVSLLEVVQLGADRIKSAEYRILAQVEAATLLWQIDRERAFAILKTASEKMRELKEKDPDTSISSKQRRLRLLAFLKIARLKPELVKDLALNNSNANKPAQATSGDWTEEARAMITVADEQIVKDPARAVQLAKQAFDFGQVDWAGFLRKLSARDSSLSEQLAMTLINRLRSSSLSPIVLLNLSVFVLTPACSVQLKDYFFESLAIRLRRVVSSTVPPTEIYHGLVASEQATKMSANYPSWQAEFERINSALQELMKARSVPDPRAGNNNVIPISAMDEIKAGDTQEIVEGLPRVGRINDSKARDARYQEAATSAALSSNLTLAEEIMSKIEDEDIRCETNMKVYSPFARKAVTESDWAGARDYASKIVDPLGRTLVLDRIAQGMLQSNKDKQSVMETYGFAAYRLRVESFKENVAKAFLILAKSLYKIDPDESLGALGWAVHILNKLSRNGELQDDFKVGEAVALWVKVPTFSLHDEVLDLTELIGPLFAEIAKRDADTAQSIANGFSDQGLYSFAQLGVVKALLENSNGTVQRPQPSSKSAPQRN